LFKSQYVYAAIGKCDMGSPAERLELIPSCGGPLNQSTRRRRIQRDLEFTPRLAEMEPRTV
jgi:hypothetical protein